VAPGTFIGGAFYPKGEKQISDAQLLLRTNRERLEFGFYIGEHDSSN
jgi:hypothetical protein